MINGTKINLTRARFRLRIPRNEDFWPLKSKIWFSKWWSHIWPRKKSCRKLNPTSKSSWTNPLYKIWFFQNPADELSFRKRFLFRLSCNHGNWNFCFERQITKSRFLVSRFARFDFLAKFSLTKGISGLVEKLEMVFNIKNVQKCPSLTF